MNELETLGHENTSAALPPTQQAEDSTTETKVRFAAARLEIAKALVDARNGDYARVALRDAAEFFDDAGQFYREMHAPADLLRATQAMAQSCREMANNPFPDYVVLDHCWKIGIKLADEANTSALETPHLEDPAFRSRVESTRRVLADAEKPSGAHRSATPPPIGAGNPSANKKVTAGVLAIVLGALGVHKFYLDYTKPGLIMCFVSVLSCGYGAIPMGIAGLIEGIIYLTRSDEEFQRTYVTGKKHWF